MCGVPSYTSAAVGVKEMLGLAKSSSSDQERIAYDRRAGKRREREYPMLRGITYLDHGGTTLTSKSALKAFSHRMQTMLLANTHSDASQPSASAMLVAETRTKVLQFFNADPAHFDIVFTANATAAIKLVAECFADLDTRFDYYYHRNAHTSLVGVRELAAHSHCFESDEATERWLSGHVDAIAKPAIKRPTLFAYPAQSNMNGERLPLSWPNRIRHNEWHVGAYSLLDVAALVTTSPLDLSDPDVAPDFVALSFYKIFGFPDLGALLVRKASAPILDHRKYFGGGTTDMTTCFGETPWVARKQSSAHARLEDGTIAIRNILALSCAMDTHTRLFGTMAEIASHTSWLAQRLYDRLRTIRHANGVALCRIYQGADSRYGDSSSQGATLAMNLRKSDGTWWNAFTVAAILRAANIHVRAGSLCNPGGMACALGLSSPAMKQAYESGFRCNEPDHFETDGVVFGMIRLSLGAMSTKRDIDTVLHFMEKRFVERTCRTRSDSHSGSALQKRAVIGTAFGMSFQMEGRNVEKGAKRKDLGPRWHLLTSMRGRLTEE